MKTPLISFVVPCYNASSHIAESINSLLNQTVKDIEIVIVDDGSFDSIDRIKQYFIKKDERIVWETLPVNKGVGNARNIGNSIAKADIIAVNDSDDMSSADRAKSIIKAFKDNNINIIHSGFSVINLMSEIIDTRDVIDFDVKKLSDTGYCYICHSTMAYRKKVAQAVPYDTEKFSKWGMDDWKFQVDCIKKGYEIKSINKILTFYRDMKNGISSGRNEVECKELKKIYMETIGGVL